MNKFCKIVYLFILFAQLNSCTSRVDRAIAQADELRGTQQYEAALASYEAIASTDSDPKVAEVWLRIGDLYYYNLQNPKKALQAYKTLIEKFTWQPAAMQAFERIALIEDAQGDYIGAIEALEMLLRYFPSHPNRHAMHHQIALYYMKMKDFGQSAIELNSLLSHDNVSADVKAVAMFDLGETYFMAGKLKEAAHWYQKVTSEFPDNELANRALQQKAKIYLELGEMGTARELEKKVKRLEPQFNASYQFISIENKNGVSKTVRAEIADTVELRTKGLQKRESLGEDEAMWFVFDQEVRSSFWMKDTLIALDLIFVDSDMNVVDIIVDASPMTTTPLMSQRPYRYVLEVPAGFVNKNTIIIGNKVSIRNIKT